MAASHLSLLGKYHLRRFFWSGLWIHTSALRVTLSSFHPVYISFNPRYWYKTLKNSIGLTCNSQESKLSDKRVLQKSFLNNHISISGFFWNDLLDLWITDIISLANVYLPTLVALFPKYYIWLSLKNPQMKFPFYLLVYSSVSLRSCFAVSSKKKQGYTFYYILLHNLS